MSCITPRAKAWVNATVESDAAPTRSTNKRKAPRTRGRSLDTPGAKVPFEVQQLEQALGTAVGSVDTGCDWSACFALDSCHERELELDGGEFAEAALTSTVVVGVLDPVGAENSIGALTRTHASPDRRLPTRGATAC